jgi:tetratricopeptide (TPR) repeat protein
MKRIVIFLFTSSLCFDLKAQAPAPDSVAGSKKVDAKEYRAAMRGGNKSYGNGKPAEAETEYRRVLGYEDKSNRAAFNLGDALYRQEKYDKAAEQFKAAIKNAGEKDDKARAYYNLGNSMLKQQKLKESIDAYKEALRNDPNDTDAKRNLSYAMRLLKQQEQQQKQNKNNRDNQGQDNKDQQNQDQKDQQNQDQQQQDQKKDDMQQRQQQQQINREDAQRMLNAIEQEEKELQEKLQKKERAGNRPKIEKNW